MEAQAAVHREDIKAQLRKQFGSLLAFERKKGLPRNSAKDVLRGKASARTERAISKALKTPLHVLFPRRYEAGQSTKVDNTSSREDAHRQFVEAR